MVGPNYSVWDIGMGQAHENVRSLPTCDPWGQVSSWQSAMVGIFTPWKSATFSPPPTLHPPRRPVYPRTLEWGDNRDFFVGLFFKWPSREHCPGDEKPCSLVHGVRGQGHWGLQKGRGLMEEEGPEEKWGPNEKFLCFRALCTDSKGILPEFGKAWTWIQVRIWKVPLASGIE